MQTVRIAELLEPFLGPSSDQRLTTSDLNNISTYIDILLRWNARINLTAIRDPEQIVTRHFGESLFAARHLLLREAPVGLFGGSAALQGRVAGAKERAASAPPASTVADLGSGAGFPGIPLKIWAPHIHLTLIEANHKKATFLREIARALTLTDIDILTTRAETLSTQFDLVTLRAVERFDAVLPVAARLVAPGGRLALLISSGQFDVACESLSDLAWSDPIAVPASHSRVLAVAHLAS